MAIEPQFIQTDYLCLIKEFNMLENKMKILEARELNLGIELILNPDNNFCTEDILELHGLESENYFVLVSNSVYKILKYTSSNILYSFIICEHGVYTPILTNQKIISESQMKRISDCLYC